MVGGVRVGSSVTARSSPWLDGCPGRVARGAIFDCAQYLLDPQTVVEGGLWLAVLGDSGDQVDGLVGEPVLVAETVPGRPPGADVRMFLLGDQDPPETLLLDRLSALTRRPPQAWWPS